MLQIGVGGSRTSQQFSTIYSDIITETTINKEVKVRGGPMRGGFSTSERTNDNFIKTSHLMAAITRKVEDKLSYVTSSAHKEVSKGSRKKHDASVCDLANQLEELVDPFLDGPDRLLVGKVKTLKERLAYPLTAMPLSLANPENTLRQGSKAILHNHLIE